MKCISGLKSVLLILLCLNTLLFNSLQAQDLVRLSGTVTSVATGITLSNAEVVLKPLNLITTTDQKGFFVFSNLKKGKYQISISHLGFNKLTETIVIEGNHDVFVELKLTEEIKTIEGIEIVGDKTDHQPYQRTSIESEEIERVPARDIGELLRSSPNVSGVRKGATNIDPVIRGMKAAQLNVQSNTGQKIEGGCPNRMDPASSHIDVNDISRIEILKGPYALRFGPVFGGVLNLITEKAVPSDVFQVRAKAIVGWESNWGGNREHVSILGGNRKVYFALSGNNQNYGNYNDGNGKEVKSSFRKYNYSAEMGINPADHHEIRFSYKGSHGRDIRFPALAMDEREDNTQLMSASYHYQNASEFFRSLDVKIYQSDVYHEMDNKWRPVSDTVVAISTVDALNRGGRVDFEFRKNQASIHAGLDYEHIFKDGQRVKNLILQPGLPVKTEDLWQNAVIQNMGLFGEYRQKQSVNLEYIFAARIDMNHATSDPMLLENMMGKPVYYNDTVDSDFLNFSISAGLSYNVNRNMAIDFALGRGVRSPDMVERFIILLPVGYDNYDYLGNPGLKPENNHQADLTLTKTSKAGCKITANTFFSYITNYITGVKVPPTELMPQTTGVLGVKRFINLDKAYMYGFELTWASPVQKFWSSSISMAYTTGFNPEATRYIYENGNATGSEMVKNDPLPEIPPLEANIKFDYKFFENRLVPELNLRLVAPQNRVSAAYDERTTPGFIIAGLRLFYSYNPQLSLAAGVNNLLDKGYYEHLNRRVIGSKMSLYEPGRIFYLNVILNI
ncbi:MAG: TonB-dependent receptor [Bacteroidales bacterium]|nr:TonB-dependent receptor [Bacteroidales bacterium]